MRRGLIMGGVWALGVVAAVALAFAAVGRVESGVAPHDATRLSQTAIDQELTSRTTAPATTATTGPGSTAASVPPSSPSAPSTTHVTTSQGGTLFTRCSGPHTIVYVAAVPRSGYERMVDVEEEDGIEQSFENGTHRSTVEATCRNGVVIAHVEENSPDDR